MSDTGLRELLKRLEKRIRPQREYCVMDGESQCRDRDYAENISCSGCNQWRWADELKRIRALVEREAASQEPPRLCPACGLRSSPGTVYCACGAMTALDRTGEAASQTASDEWVVIVGNGSWTRCYGRFQTYDAVVAWVRANGWHPSDVNILPIVGFDKPGESLQ